jgi:hypothetical protein
MKFGLFYEHQLPRPYEKDQWDPDAEQRLFKNALDQIELLDGRARRRCGCSS